MVHIKKPAYAKITSLLHLMKVLLVAGALVGTVGCDAIGSNNNGEGSDNNSSMRELSFFEEELVGLWSRYHRYDGSTQYIRFNADRTACKWEEPGGSDRRIDTSNYTSWEIGTDQASSNGHYDVQVKGAGIRWTFDYPDDVVWPGTYTNLKYSPTAADKTCE